MITLFPYDPEKLPQDFDTPEEARRFVAEHPDWDGELEETEG